MATNRHGVTIEALIPGDWICIEGRRDQREVVRVVSVDGARGGIVDTKPIGGRHSKTSGFVLGDEITRVDRMAVAKVSGERCEMREHVGRGKKGQSLRRRCRKAATQELVRLVGDPNLPGAYEARSVWCDDHALELREARHGDEGVSGRWAAIGGSK